MDINLKGAFFCAQEAASMMKDRGGSIVNISSGTSTETLPGRAPYYYQQGRITWHDCCTGSQWAKYHIQVNAVARMIPDPVINGRDKYGDCQRKADKGSRSYEKAG